MRRFVVPALAVAFLALGPARAQDARLGADLEGALVDLAARARERTVLIYGVIGLGSGAVVDPTGLVVTNAHVVAGARYALVQWPDGTTELARQRGIDFGRDLAVLEPVEPGRDRPHFELATKTPAEGTWVVALGFPGGLQTTGSPTVSLGRVLGIGNGAGASAALDYSQAIRHDAPIFSGNSGGPLVDLEGQLLGINGAVDLESAVSLTIPADAVAERLESLEGGVIVLPGGRTIDPDESMLLRGLYRLLDPLARRLPEQIAEASRRMAEDEALPRLPEAIAGDFDPETADRLAVIARASKREAVLDRLQGAPAAPVAIALHNGGFATRVGAEHAVCKASFLEESGDAVTLGDGTTATIVARSQPDDLALLRLPRATAPGAAEAPVPPVGSLVQVRDAQAALLASGIASVEPRRASATLAAQIRSGGVPDVVERAIDSFEQLVDRVNVEPLQALVEQLRKAIDQRKAFAAGTPPRGYAQVMAVDAPVRPSDMGAPVCDRQGRLLGVAIGVQHHGTTYVVPMSRVREVFAEALGGAPARPAQRWPERLGEARLY
jgi:S1-C subfamily serine protease